MNWIYLLGHIINFSLAAEDIQRIFCEFIAIPHHHSNQVTVKVYCNLQMLGLANRKSQESNSSEEGHWLVLVRI